MPKTKVDWSKVQRKKAPFHVNVRLTPEENEQLIRVAEALGVSKAGYVKSAVFGKPIPRRARRPAKASADLSQVLGLLGKLGSNANQIARACNAGTLHDYREATASLQGIRDELTVLRALLLKALEEVP